MSLLAELGVSLPVLAAPMAGGPSTPGSVVAAAAAGSLGFVAGGYRTPGQLAEQIREVRSATSTFGVNLFAPNPVPVDRDEYSRYALDLASTAARFGVTLPPQPIEDDDGWVAKLDLLLADPVPLVSFTFGLPPTSAIRALHRVGTVIAQSVTGPQEARWAQDVGVDALIVQGPGAGGHSAVFDPTVPPSRRALSDLVSEIGSTTRLPLLAGGGLASPADVADVLRAGATAALVGTALLLADEAGTSAVHRRAIVARTDSTIMTRAFTGRPARGLPNEFTRRFDPIAPGGYPALHHLSSPVRRAAAATGDPEWVHLWAGTGYRRAVPGPVSQILRRLAGDQVPGTGGVDRR